MSDKASDGNKKDGRRHITFTFENGVTVELRRVSPLTIQEFGNSFPEPKPPKQTVDYGQGPVVEENRSHPGYLKEMAEHTFSVTRKMMDFTLWRGVKCDVDHAAVEEVRRDATMFGGSLEGDDKLIYIKHVLVSTSEELGRLRDAILSQGQPTEAAIAEKQAGLKSDVQG